MLSQAPRHIAFFLTGHGFGHGVRASILINALPAHVQVTVFTTLPESFFAEEVRREPGTFRRIYSEIDCGCVQYDTVSIDIAATLAKYARLHDERERLMAEHVSVLRDIGADLVLGDIPPLAFPIAKAAGLPSVSLGNFAWTDIYDRYLDAHEAAPALWQRMLEDYACADLHLLLDPYHGASLEQAGLRCEEVGLLARRGELRREALARNLGLDPESYWALIYVGSHGLPGIDWSRLERFGAWQFFGLYDLPGARRYRRIEKTPGFSYADLTANSDVILGKLGYGLVGEALANATPILFTPRRDFSEYESLKLEVERRGMGREISLEAIRNLELDAALEWALKRQLTPQPAPAIHKILKKLGYES